MSPPREDVKTLPVSDPADGTQQETLGWADRLLRPFADVRACEAASSLVLAATIFTLLTAYYLLKVIREPLILTGGGAEVKAYASTGQALLLIPVLRAHGAIARRVGRLKLIAAVLLFCASNLVIFSVLTRTGAAIGVPFYLWVGTFNFLLVATFWSFANDVYTPDQGKRLFPIVGVGSSVGALAGAALAGLLLHRLAPADLMLASAGLLTGTLGLFAWTHTHDRCWPKDRGKLVRRSEPLGGEGGFHTLLNDRYLLLIGLIAILANWVTNSGEYVLDRTLVGIVADQGLQGAAVHRFIGQFKANYFWWVNLLAVLAQLLLVSRILKYFGVGGALLVLPVVAMLGAASMALIPVLGLIRTAKIAEKSTDYSLQNTAQNALYLVVSRSAKYKAKAVVDSFLVRAGDVCAAGAIFVGAQLGLDARAFSALNVVLALTWLGVAWKVRALHRKRLDQIEPASRPLAGAAAEPA
jgi:AAA family ATP:ADP antiporter